MIIVELIGGLGNQMFQYAIGRSLSIKNNIPLGLNIHYLLDRTPRKNFTFRDFDLDLFNIKAEVLPKSKIPFWYRYVGKGLTFLILSKLRSKFSFGRGIEKQNFVFDKSVYEHKDSIYLRGYWQSPKYFHDIRDILKEDFSLKNPLSEQVKILSEEIKSIKSLCVNVRRTDFVNNNFHGTLGIDYYQRGILEILKYNNIDKIYIFSDDIGWCKENLKFDLDYMYVDYEYKGIKFEEYFYLMMCCKNFIIPNSSFAWWAAYLSNSKEKKVIAPRVWVLDSSINTKDLIPDDWIRI